MTALTRAAAKPGIRVEAPGAGSWEIRVLVTDFSGTLSCGGKLTAGVQRRLLQLDELVDIHVLTSDTFGTVRRELANIPAHIHVLESDRHDLQKRRFVQEECETASVLALGNGNNDRLMLLAVRDAGGIAVAIDNGEGCATATLQSANLCIRGAAEALDLLLDPNRLKAGLRL